MPAGDTLGTLFRLKKEQDQVRPALHPVLGQKIGDVELSRSFGHVQPARDLLVGEVL
jgi:hypothetical protein